MAKDDLGLGPLRTFTEEQLLVRVVKQNEVTNRYLRTISVAVSVLAVLALIAVVMSVLAFSGTR